MQGNENFLKQATQSRLDTATETCQRASKPAVPFWQRLVVAVIALAVVQAVTGCTGPDIRPSPAQEADLTCHQHNGKLICESN